MSPFDRISHLRFRLARLARWQLQAGVGPTLLFKLVNQDRVKALSGVIKKTKDPQAMKMYLTVVSALQKALEPSIQVVQALQNFLAFMSRPDPDRVQSLLAPILDYRMETRGTGNLGKELLFKIVDRKKVLSTYRTLDEDGQEILRNVQLALILALEPPRMMEHAINRFSNLLSANDPAPDRIRNDLGKIADQLGISTRGFLF